MRGDDREPPSRGAAPSSSSTHEMRQFDAANRPESRSVGYGLFESRRRSPRRSSWATRKIQIDEFPNEKRWLEEIGERPAVKKAMAMGPKFREDPASISAEEQSRRRKLVADQRAQPIPSEWIRAAYG